MLVGIPATGGADLLPMLIADAGVTMGTNAVLSKTGAGIRAEGALADIFNLGFMFFAPEGDAEEAAKELAKSTEKTSETLADKTSETAARAAEAEAAESAASAAARAKKEAAEEVRAGERAEKEAAAQAEKEVVAQTQKRTSAQVCWPLAFIYAFIVLPFLL